MSKIVKSCENCKHDFEFICAKTLLQTQCKTAKLEGWEPKDTVSFNDVEKPEISPEFAEMAKERKKILEANAIDALKKIRNTEGFIMDGTTTAEINYKAAYKSTISDNYKLRRRVWELENGIKPEPKADLNENMFELSSEWNEHKEKRKDLKVDARKEPKPRNVYHGC